MFQNLIGFNRDIGNWDVSSATDMVSIGANLMTMIAFFFLAVIVLAIKHFCIFQINLKSLMFNGATSFNQDIGRWNVSQNTKFVSIKTHVKTNNSRYFIKRHFLICY